MQTLILTLYIIVCILLVILILLQSGKEGMGVIFGGGNSSVFGSTGAGGILAKLTAFMAVVFVITALSYTYVTSSRPSSESTILDVRIEDAPATSAAPEARTSEPAAAVETKTTESAPATESRSSEPVSPAEVKTPETPDAASDTATAPQKPEGSVKPNE